MRLTHVLIYHTYGEKIYNNVMNFTDIIMHWHWHQCGEIEYASKFAYDIDKSIVSKYALRTSSSSRGLVVKFKTTFVRHIQ